MSDKCFNSEEKLNEKDIVEIYTGKEKITPETATITEGIRYVSVHEPGEDDYKFTLGVSIIKHKNFWVSAYLQSKDKENDDKSRFVCKYSYDDCETWSDIHIIAEAEEEYSRSHGILWNNGDELWTFCPRANFGKHVSGDVYPNLIMEAYILGDDMNWTYKGIASNDSFWPLCEPIELSDGSLLIAGLECGSNTWQGAVAISSGNPLDWKMVVIPNPDEIQIWGETTVIKSEGVLEAIVRTNRPLGYAAVSTSYDNGLTWSDLKISNLSMVATKPYGGILSDGRKYLIFNIPQGYDTLQNLRNRKTLAIAISGFQCSSKFEKIYLIKNGYSDAPLWFSRQWAYPYAVENDGHLYVVYSKHKEGNELAIIPIKQIK